MAIQQVDLTVPGGDTPRSANTKINANFSNQTHAASRLVGTANGQIPLAQDTYNAANKTTIYIPANSSIDANGFDDASRYAVETAGNLNMPPVSDVLIETSTTFDSAVGILQKAWCAYGQGAYFRNKIGIVWSEWFSMGVDRNTYTTTTAAGANVVVDTAGKLMRSTSSERYKDILAPLELDDARYADAMSLKPIVYRSTADADNPAYHYYSFSAEELGAYDPAFTLWRETEAVTDADGNVTEQPLAERQAEGININALLAMSHAIAIKQDKMIKAQAEAIATLTQRIDAITA